MTNSEHPVYPVSRPSFQSNGLTKREYFCLHCMVPETGDEELDRIIRHARRPVVPKIIISWPKIIRIVILLIKKAYYWRKFRKTHTK